MVSKEHFGGSIEQEIWLSPRSKFLDIVFVTSGICNITSAIFINLLLSFVSLLKQAAGEGAQKSTITSKSLENNGLRGSSSPSLKALLPGDAKSAMFSLSLHEDRNLSTTSCNSGQYKAPDGTCSNDVCDACPDDTYCDSGAAICVACECSGFCDGNDNSCCQK